MAELTAEQAVSISRAQVDVDERVPGRAWLVRRLDRPGAAYYLVVFCTESGSVAVATVDAATSEVGTSARLPGGSRHLRIDAARARAIAGASEESEAELIWAPGTASRSPLYPLWQVAGPNGRVYVDQRGVVWKGLR